MITCRVGIRVRVKVRVSEDEDEGSRLSSGVLVYLTRFTIWVFVGTGLTQPNCNLIFLN